MLAVIFLPWVLFITFKMCTAKRVDKEIHLIPKDYKGDVYILFNQKEGVSPKYGNKKERIYEIPSTGVLKTTFAPNKGAFSKGDRRFYYTDKNGNKLRAFNYLTSFDLYHKTYEKAGSTIKEDSVLVFDLAGNQTLKFDSVLGINPIDKKNLEFLFYRVDSFKNRL